MFGKLAKRGRQAMNKVAVRGVVAAMGGREKLRQLATRQEGQTLVEYGLIIALIAIAVIAAIILLGGKLKNTFNNISGQLG